MGDVSVLPSQEHFDFTMKGHTIYIAWSLSLLAVLAWAGIGSFAYRINVLENTREANMQSVQAHSRQSVQASYLHGVVMASATQRAQLDALIAVDPASLADMINSVGTSTGVAIKISNASAENVSSVDGKMTLQGFSFLASAEGNFASALYAASLLESLPIPSSVQQINLTHAESAVDTSGGNAAWQMSAQVRVLSVSNTSS